MLRTNDVGFANSPPIFPPSIIRMIMDHAIKEHHDLSGYTLLSRECLDRCRAWKFEVFTLTPDLDSHACLLFAGGDLYKYVKALKVCERPGGCYSAFGCEVDAFPISSDSDSDVSSSSDAGSEDSDGSEMETNSSDSEPDDPPCYSDPTKSVGIRISMERTESTEPVVDYSWMMTFAPLLDALRNVQCITLCHLSWGDVPVDVRRIIRTRFTDAEHLSVHAVDFWNSNQLAMLLGSFPALRALVVNAPWWVHISHTPRQMAITTPLRLQMFQVSCNEGEHIIQHHQILFQWLSGNREVLSIRDFFGHTSLDMLPQLIRLMPRMLSSVKRFILDFSVCNDTWEENVDITRNKTVDLEEDEIGAGARGDETANAEEYESMDTGLDGTTDTQAGILEFDLEDDETEGGVRVYPNVAELDQLERMCRSERGRAAIVAETAAAFHFLHPFDYSRVRELTLTIRWKWTPLALLAVRFILWLVSGHTSFIDIRVLFDDAQELESFPWKELDAELCKAPLDIAAPFEVDINLVGPDTLSELYSKITAVGMLPKFSAISRELGIVLKFRKVYYGDDTCQGYGHKRGSHGVNTSDLNSV